MGKYFWFFYDFLDKLIEIKITRSPEENEFHEMMREEEQFLLMELHCPLKEEKIPLVVS